MKKNKFAYTGLIRCANCGSLVSADKKTKIIKKTGKEKTFVYYRCNHKKPRVNCQEKAVSLPKLEEQIEKELEKYDFLPDFQKLLFKIMKETKDEDPEERQNITNNLNKKIKEKKQEKNNLTKLSCRGLILDDEFTDQRNDYEKEINLLQEKISSRKGQNSTNDEKLEDVKFATRALIKFKKGDDDTRRIIINRLGSNRTLSTRKLLIQPHNHIVAIEKYLKPLEAKFATFEIEKALVKTK